MSRGGYRPGAGRPKGSKDVAGGIRLAARQQTPLDYLLGVLNDGAADANRRDRVAIALLPFVHSRVADRPAGKRQEQQEAGIEAARGRFAPAAPPLKLLKQCRDSALER